MSELKGSLSVRAMMLLPWLVALVVAEAKTGRLPNVLTIGCLSTGLVVSIMTDGISVWNAILGAVAGDAIFIPAFLTKSCGAGEVKTFAAVMSFWGVKLLPFAFVSSFFMALVRRSLSRWFVNLKENRVPSSPFMLLTALSTIVAMVFWNGHGMAGGYVFIVVALLAAVCARRLLSGKAPSPPKELMHCCVVADPATIDPRTDSHEVDWTSTTSNGDASRNPLADKIAKGTIEVSGFRFKQSISKSRTNMLFHGECVEDGCMGLKIGTPVVVKLVEETDALPSFSNLQEAISRLQKVKSGHVVRYYGCLQAEYCVEDWNSDQSILLCCRASVVSRFACVVRKTGRGVRFADTVVADCGVTAF